MADWKLDPKGYVDPEDYLYHHTNNPIQTVIGADRWSSSGKNRPRLCKPGDNILLSEGEYHHFRVTHSFDEGPEPDPMTTFIGAPGNTIIKNNPVGGSTSMYLEWAGAQAFHGINFRGDDHSALQTENPWSLRWMNDEGELTHPNNRDIEFHDCWVDGGWSAHTNKGPKNKWGLQSYGIGRSVRGKAGWEWKGGGISGIFEEHAKYIHNPQGDITIERGRFSHCGRTWLQFTGRKTDYNARMPEAFGDVYLRDNLVEDMCLEAGGGGSAITIKGGHRGSFILHNNSVKMGCDKNLHPSLRGNISGCLVAHKGGNAHDVKPDLLIQGGRYSQGRYWRGDRPNFKVSNLKKFKMHKVELWSWPGSWGALELDRTSIDDIEITSENDIRGDILLTQGNNSIWFRDETWGDGKALKGLRSFLYS